MMGINDLQQPIQSTILVVDDEPTNLALLKDVLHHGGYRPIFANSGERALVITTEQQPDMILLDIMMPHMDGYEVCRRLQESPHLKRIPILFVTALGESQSEKKGLDLGAVDYITKPIDPSLLLARIKNHLALAMQRKVAERALFRTTAQLQVKRKSTERIGKQLESSYLESLLMLHRASLLRDNETGLHVERTAHYVHMLALKAGMGQDKADMAALAAPMHDIGKIGIPDSILLKPGRLDDDELVIMRTHAWIGAKIIGDNPVTLLHQMAYDIALTHHERWDGDGYPKKIKGEKIPLIGRIMSLADVFDALTSQRPYKKAWEIDQAMNEIKINRGLRFDPGLVDLFIQLLEEGRITAVMKELADPVHDPSTV